MAHARRPLPAPAPAQVVSNLLTDIHDAVSGLTQGRLLPGWHFGMPILLAMLSRLEVAAVSAAAEQAWSIPDVLQR